MFKEKVQKEKEAVAKREQVRAENGANMKREG